jgi:hypothetical protein
MQSWLVRNPRQEHWCTVFDLCAAWCQQQVRWLTPALLLCFDRIFPVTTNRILFVCFHLILSSS